MSQLHWSYMLCLYVDTFSNTMQYLPNSVGQDILGTPDLNINYQVWLLGTKNKLKNCTHDICFIDYNIHLYDVCFYVVSLRLYQHSFQNEDSEFV